MENLKEEIENVKTGFSKTASDFSDILLDRFKNPYITAFSISWIACNWKPIAFFALSKGNVEYKIRQISLHYTDIWHYLWWPILLSLFFLFIIPYLNLGSEWFVKRSVKKRADYIKDQIVDKINRDKHIAIANYNQQKAVRELKEGEDHDNFIEKIETQLTEVKYELEKQINLNYSNSSRYNEELKNINNHFTVQLEKQRQNYLNLLEEKNSLQEALGNEQEASVNFENEIQARQSQIDLLQDQISKSDAINSLFIRNIGHNILRKDNLFIFQDGEKVIETYNENNEITYIRVNDGEYIAPQEILRKMNSIFFDEIFLKQNELKLYMPYELPDDLLFRNFIPRDRL